MVTVSVEVLQGLLCLLRCYHGCCVCRGVTMVIVSVEVLSWLLRTYQSTLVGGIRSTLLPSCSFKSQVRVEFASAGTLWSSPKISKVKSLLAICLKLN